MSNLKTLDVEFEFVTTADRAEAFAPMVRDAEILYLDTETTPKPQFRHNKRAGLVPAMTDVRLLQLYVHGFPVWVIDLFRVTPDQFPELAAALTAADGPITVAHNAVFDCSMTINAGLAIPQQRWRCTALQERHLTCGQMIQGVKKRKRDKQGFDVDSEAFDWETSDIEQQEEQLLRDMKGNEITFRPVPCDLKATAERRCKIEMDKTNQRSDWGIPELSLSQIEYGAGDSLILEQIYLQQVAEIQREGMGKAVRLDNLCIEPVARAQMRGIRLSPEGWPAMIEQLKAERAETEKTLLQAVSDGLVEIGDLALPRDMLGRIRNDKVNGWKPGSRDQVLRTFHRLGIEIDDLSKTARGLCKSKHPAFLAFNAWKKDQSLVQSAESYVKHICPADGLIHGDIAIFRADTGRMAISRPSLQNIPRGPLFRGNIVSRASGRVLVGADFPQIEVRFAALISGDPVLRQVFMDDLDVYKFTGAFLSRTTYEECTANNRKLAKPCVLGLCFGLGAAKLADYSTLSFGIDMSEDQAKDYRKDFFNQFQRLGEWHAEMGAEVDQPNYIPLEARSLLGRRRKLEGWKRKFTTRVNTPIQASAGELAKAVIAALPGELAKAGCKDTHFCLAIHDEILLDAEASEAEAAKEVLARVMSRYGERMLGMPCPVKAVIGNSWNEAKD